MITAPLTAAAQLPAPSMALLLAALAALAALAGTARGSLHDYDNVVFPRDALMFRKSGMYGPNDAPAGQGNPSFIKVDLTLAREEPEYHGEAIKAQIAIFDESNWDKVGIKGKTADGSAETVYCCTKELVKQNLCTEPMTLIFRPDPEQGSYITSVLFPQDPEWKERTAPVRIEGKFDIPFKGVKVLLFATCNDLAGNVIINGKTEWKNPYGYLPGELYGFLPFYSQLAVFYLVIALLWAVLCACHWRELMILQNCVTIVICLGMMEMGFRYFDMAAFNNLGTRGSVLMFTGSLFHTLKQTVTRLLILVVAMGFGVVKPSLGSTTYRVLALGGFYFFFSATQRVYELASHTSTITFVQYVLLLPVAFLDLVFFFWTFLSCNQIINKLSSREQGVKLELYVRFRRLLFLTMLVGSTWSALYAFLIISGSIFHDWERRWLFEGFFDVMYLMCLLGIMILWRPTNNSQAFAYQKVSTRGPGDDDNNDGEEYGHDLAEELELVPSKKPAAEDSA